MHRQAIQRNFVNIFFGRMQYRAHEIYIVPFRSCAHIVVCQRLDPTKCVRISRDSRLSVSLDHHWKASMRREIGSDCKWSATASLLDKVVSNFLWLRSRVRDRALRPCCSLFKAESGFWKWNSTCICYCCRPPRTLLYLHLRTYENIFSLGTYCKDNSLCTYEKRKGDRQTTLRDDNATIARPLEPAKPLIWASHVSL